MEPWADEDERRLLVPVLDIEVTPMTAEELVAWIDRTTERALVLNHNLHSAYLYARHKPFRVLYNKAEKVVIDGTPILWLSRIHDPVLTSHHRIGSTDWIGNLNRASGGRLAVYGATQESNRKAVARLTKELSAHGWVVGGMHGYKDESEAMEWLEAFEPSLVLVGLGMPRQERFLAENWSKLPPAVYATVGGAIDYISGANVLAPRWLGVLGLEWLWRLTHEPKRLAHRYIVEPLALLGLVMARQIRSRS